MGAPVTSDKHPLSEVAGAAARSWLGRGFMLVNPSAAAMARLDCAVLGPPPAAELG